MTIRKIAKANKPVNGFANPFQISCITSNVFFDAFIITILQYRMTSTLVYSGLLWFLISLFLLAISVFLSHYAQIISLFMQKPHYVSKLRYL